MVNHHHQITSILSRSKFRSDLIILISSRTVTRFVSWNVGPLGSALLSWNLRAKNRSPSYALNASREAGTWGCLFGRGEPEDDGDATKRGCAARGAVVGGGWNFPGIFKPGVALASLAKSRYTSFAWDQDLFQLSLIKCPSDTNQEIITLHIHIHDGYLIFTKVTVSISKIHSLIIHESFRIDGGILQKLKRTKFDSAVGPITMIRSPLGSGLKISHSETYHIDSYRYILYKIWYCIYSLEVQLSCLIHVGLRTTSFQLSKDVSSS